MRERFRNLDMSNGPDWKAWVMPYYRHALREAYKGNEKRYPGLRYKKNKMGIWEPQPPQKTLTIQEKEAMVAAAAKMEEEETVFEDLHFVCHTISNEVVEVRTKVKAAEPKKSKNHEDQKKEEEREEKKQVES